MEEQLQWGLFPTWPSDYCWILLPFFRGTTAAFFVHAVGDGDGVVVRCIVAIRFLCLLFLCVFGLHKVECWWHDGFVFYLWITDCTWFHAPIPFSWCYLYLVGGCNMVWQKHHHRLITEAIPRICLAFLNIVAITTDYIHFCTVHTQVAAQSPAGQMFSRINRK